MTHRNIKIRPAMTAIAAVIALSSTPLFAQVADEPITSEPIVDTAPAPAAADPLAAEPVAETAPAADPLAAAPAAKPAARKATTARPTVARSRPAPARVASSAPAVAAAPVAVTIAPVAAAPVEPLPTQLEVPPVEAPIEQPPATDAIAMDETMLAAGAGGLAILALAGAGLAVRRRRRRRAEEAEIAQWQHEIENSDAALAPAESAEPQRAPIEPKPGYMPEQGEPAFVRAFADAPVVASAATPVVAPAPSAEIDGPTTDLPEGFDLSRFSPNVQAAYKGPTEDNPSLSLKYRLRRASGMDQLEEREADPSSPVEAPAAKPTVPQHDKVDFMLAKAGKKPGARPASITSGRPTFSH